MQFFSWVLFQRIDWLRQFTLGNWFIQMVLFEVVVHSFFTYWTCWMLDWCTKNKYIKCVHKGAWHHHHIYGLSAGVLLVRGTRPQQSFWRACHTDILWWELNSLRYCKVFPKMESDSSRQIIFSDCLPFIINSTHTDNSYCCSHYCQASQSIWCGDTL